jgi:hypothetical protein
MNRTQFASLTIGMLECWNIGIMGSGLRLGESNGMMGLKKKESKLIKLYGYSRNIGVFFGAKEENGYLTTIIRKVGFNIFCRIDLFPLFIPSIPTFHYSIIPCGLPTRAATKNTIFLKSCRNSETFNYKTYNQS